MPPRRAPYASGVAKRSFALSREHRREAIFDSAIVDAPRAVLVARIPAKPAVTQVRPLRGYQYRLGFSIDP